MSLVKEQHLFLLDIAKLIYFADQQGIVLTAGECYRTNEQQEIYVREGKSQTMNSNHRKRLAMDFNFFIDDVLTYDKEKLSVLGEYWESLSENNKWGGFWKFVDSPHFERRV